MLKSPRRPTFCHVKYMDPGILELVEGTRLLIFHRHWYLSKRIAAMGYEGAFYRTLHRFGVDALRAQVR
jgi:hypothetical protein